jgi:osmotically-inducible protein OsmY
MNEMSKYDREDPAHDRGARDRELTWRDRVRDDPSRREDPSRRDERFGQALRREDDYSASDYRYDYRSARYGAEDRDDDRRPGRHPGEDRDDYNYSGHSGSPYYGAGYSGPYASGARDAGRYPERSSVPERYPYARGQQEQAWSRDPRTEEGYGHDYEARWPASGSGSEAYHRPVRWRSESELGSRETRSGQRGWSNSEGARNLGNYGKGPKGYVRSDERIREDVCDRLSDDDELDASDITVTVSNGEVRLEGSVLDRHSKHHAEDLVESVSGVRDITNNLRARKGFLREMGDKLSGEDRDDHRGHAGSGTHNSPSQSSPPQGSPLQNSTLGNSNKGGTSANR